MDLYSLLYVSRSRVDNDKAAMQSIAEAAQRNNGQRGITGFLYHDADTFLQVLEGSEGDVRAIFDKIAADDRHEKVHLLGFQPVSNRAFGGWSMGLYDGGIDGGLLADRFGEGRLGDATGKDVGEVMRFLRDLSLGRDDIYRLPSKMSA